MRMTRLVVGMFCLAAAAWAQTAEELVAKNLQAKGGVEKIKAVNTLKMRGKAYVGINAEFSQENKRPNMIRNVTGHCARGGAPVKLRVTQPVCPRIPQNSVVLRSRRRVVCESE